MPYLIFVFWLFGFVLLWKISFPRQQRIVKTEEPEISVIIPARNEENNLPPLLQSLNNQTMRPLEVIVVDDQSRDSTAETGKRYGCNVIHSRDLPEDWNGKPWACWQGANEAKGKILLFLDADTCLDKNALLKLVSVYSEKEGLLSVQPYHKMRRLYERLSAIFNIVVLSGMNAFTVFGQRLKPSGAFGPCIMCLKNEYMEIKGHKNVRAEILENIALGKVFLKKGYPVTCYGGKGIISFRMYPDGLRSMVEGFSKGFGIGAMAISPVSLILISCWIYGSVTVTRHCILLLYAGHFSDALIWIILDLLYSAQIYWMLFRIGNFGFITALFFQIPVLFFVIIFALSAVKTFLFKKARWKGRILNTRKKRSTL